MQSLFYWTNFILSEYCPVVMDNITILRILSSNNGQYFLSMVKYNQERSLKMIKREKYLKEIRPFYESDLIKIITGIRRCGKSVLLSQIHDELRQKSDNIIYLDFEDAAVLSSFHDPLSLIEYVSEKKKDSLCYVFLDEIQRLDGWADVCRTLRLRNCSVFISGSNSKLLSGEFTKELSGRYVSFRIHPFVYRELAEYAEELNRTYSISDYLIWGGFPKRIEYEDEAAQRAYLNDLNETIIINDIINRYSIRNTELFRRLANYVFISNSRILSARSVTRYLKGEGISCSITTISQYISYLEEAYAISSIKRYSRKAKRELEYFFKVYNEDLSLNSIRTLGSRYDLTHNLENAVYNELLYMGYTLQVYVDDKFEIDFIASKQNKTYLIQVAYSVAEEKAYDREFRPFSNIGNESQKILITTDDIDFSTSTVRHISFRDFVYMDEL